MKKFIALVFVLLISAFAKTAYAKTDELRGVWVSTVYNLDFPSKATADSATLAAEIDSQVSECKRLGFNAVFLQVRPNSDAIYPSKYFPWSRYLTGECGKAPTNNFDPLAYWIKKCHENSIQLHAWINPYKITRSKDTDFSTLSADNPAVLHPEWVVKYSDGNYYYNPAIPEVRQLVLDGVSELVGSYDIDGIHMDDYFYPGTDFNDSEQFAVYNPQNFADIGDWRRENVNMLIRGIQDIVHTSGKNIVFGISPSGIWDNKSSNPLGSDTRGKSSYTDLYADSRKWVKDGMIDYIAPQIYWEFGFSIADYGILANWWSDVCRGTNVKLYIGLADYRSVDAKVSSPWYGGSEIARQMEYNKASEDISGEIHFRLKMILSDANLQNIISKKYEKPIDIYVNGKKIISDTPVQITNDRTMVPMRAVFESLGASVDWDATTGTASGKLNNITVAVTVGSGSLIVNGAKKSLDSPAYIYGDRMYIPLRAVSEAFEFDVEWYGDKREVYVKSS